MLIERLKRAGQHYRLIHKPDGTIEVEVLGPEDHALAMKAVARIGDMTREPFIQQAVAESHKTARAAAASPKPAPPTVPVARQVVPETSHLPNKPVGKAIDEWEAEIKFGTCPKTLVIKRMAVADFVKVLGSRRPVFEVTRVEIGAWVSELRARNLATHTIVNRLSYFKGFLEWCKGKGFIEFPRNDFQLDNLPGVVMDQLAVRQVAKRLAHSPGCGDRSATRCRARWGKFRRGFSARTVTMTVIPLQRAAAAGPWD